MEKIDLNQDYDNFYSKFMVIGKRKRYLTLCPFIFAGKKNSGSIYTAISACLFRAKFSPSACTQLMLPSLSTTKAMMVLMVLNSELL